MRADGGPGAEGVFPAGLQRGDEPGAHPVGDVCVEAAHAGDVVAEAQREGSLDSRIRNHASNDLMALVESLPHLVAVAFNGGTAARLGMRALLGAAGNVEFISLPSSSPAYTMPYAEKLKAWEALRGWLVEPSSAKAAQSTQNGRT